MTNTLMDAFDKVQYWAGRSDDPEYLAAVKTIEDALRAYPDLLDALVNLISQLPSDDRIADYNLDLAEVAILKATGKDYSQ